MTGREIGRKCPAIEANRRDGDSVEGKNAPSLDEAAIRFRKVDTNRLYIICIETLANLRYIHNCSSRINGGHLVDIKVPPLGCYPFTGNINLNGLAASIARTDLHEFSKRYPGSFSSNAENADQRVPGLIPAGPGSNQHFGIVGANAARIVSDLYELSIGV